MMKNPNKIYFPMLVPDLQQTADPSQSMLLRWANYDTLPERAKDLLTAEQTVDLIKELSRQVNLLPDSTAHFSALVRQLLFGEIDESFFTTQTHERLGIGLVSAQDFIKSLFALNTSVVTKSVNNQSIDYASADAATIAQCISARAMEDHDAQSKFFQRLQSPHFANELLSIIAINYYPKLEFVNKQYTQAMRLQKTETS